MQRLGYNLFWLHKKSDTFSFHNFNSLFDLIQKELRKKSFICFKIKRVSKEIYLTLYCLALTSKWNKSLLSIKQTSVLNIKWLYNLRKKFSNIYNITNIKRHISSITQKYITIEIILYKIVFYKFILVLDKLNLSNILNKYLSRVLNTSAMLYRITNTKYSKLNKYTSQNRNNYFKSQTSKYLRLKLFEVYFEIVLNKYYVVSYTITITNLLGGLIAEHFISRYDQKTLNLISNTRDKRFYFILYLLFISRNVELFSRYVGSSLIVSHRHRKSIMSLTKPIYYLYSKLLINPKGFKLYISGKLNGKMKRSKYAYKLGEMWISTFQNYINYFYLPLYTKFGVLSIKVWLAY